MRVTDSTSNCDHGNRWKSFAFYVTDKPSLSVSPNDVESNASASLTVECQASGNPPPEIEWDVAEKSNRFRVVTRRTNDTTISAITVDKLTVKDNGGLTCYASNVVGRVNKTLILRVKGRET